MTEISSTMAINDLSAISSTMVIQNNQNPPPRWLRHWLELEFYKDKCKKHLNKYKTVFCCACMGKPVCESCWKDSKEEHLCHPCLQVCAASRRAGIEIENIKEICDISHIQLYKINNKNIVYLNPNTGGAAEQKGDVPKCEICNRKLINSKYNFCSIACKVTTINLSPRKHPRKGIPRRSPLK